MEVQRVLFIVDPNRTGRIAFDAFLDFITRETQDRDTAEQLVDSFRILAQGKVRVPRDKTRLASCPQLSRGGVGASSRRV